VVSLSSAAPNARQAAAQAVAKVGKIELPTRRWPELIEGLANAAFADGVPDGTKAASVTALGYLCEEIVRCDPCGVAAGACGCCGWSGCCTRSEPA
jgi:importin subunit beta-1